LYFDSGKFVSTNHTQLKFQEAAHPCPGLVRVIINTLASGFWGFSEKNAKTHVALRRNISGPGRSIKRRSKFFSLHSKKIFYLGVRVFSEWHNQWRTFRPPWPTLPGPGRQPLGGSILLKFLQETRLQSECFDTLDDLLGFRVQKLW